MKLPRTVMIGKQMVTLGDGDYTILRRVLAKEEKRANEARAKAVSQAAAIKVEAGAKAKRHLPGGVRRPGLAADD